MHFCERVAVFVVLLCLCSNLPASSAEDFSRISWTNEHGPSQLPSPDLKVEDFGEVVELFSRYWRNDWSSFPQNVAESAQALANKQNSSNSSCIDGWTYLSTHSSLTKMGMNTPLVVQAVDAFGKPGAGILEGNVIAYGGYDECLSIDHTHYCLVPMSFLFDGKPISISPLSSFRVGMCLPVECTVDDIINTANLVNEIESKIPGHFNVSIQIDRTMVYCESEKKLPYNAGAIVMLAVCAVFGCLVLAGTIFDWILIVINSIMEDRNQNAVLHVNPDFEKNPLEHTPLLGKPSTVRSVLQAKPTAAKVLTSFSLFETVPAILSTKQPSAAITCVHGLRVLSICWVILCHTHTWTLTETGLSNPMYVFTEVGPRFSYQVIVNGFFSVDSFFFLSGLLVAYLTLRNMSRKNGRFPAVTYYVHRYLRLTPSYAFVLFFYWFLTMHLASGPAFHATTGENSLLYTGCEKYWWTNLLYINNLYPWSMQEQCMGWGWYLANDMQFYVVSPLLIVLLYYIPIVGILAVAFFLVGSFAATGAISGYYHFDASFKGLMPAVNSSISFMDEIYVKPYARISPYLVGLVLGFMLYKKVKSPLRKLYNWLLVYIPLWLVAICLGFAAVYGLYDTWHGHNLSTAEDVMYITFSRFTWGLALALLVFICHNGYGWVINSFLSMSFWIPLSRVSFNAYLVHEVVLTVVFGNLRNPVYYTDITLAVFAVGSIIISYGAATVVSVCVEYPLGSIETMLFKAIGLGTRESTRQATNGNAKTTELK